MYEVITIRFTHLQCKNNLILSINVRYLIRISLNKINTHFINLKKKGNETKKRIVFQLVFNMLFTQEWRSLTAHSLTILTNRYPLVSYFKENYFNNLIQLLPSIDVMLQTFLGRVMLVASSTEETKLIQIMR